jgi:asparagine synthetase B (glutamine-hydrolysing)
VIKYPKEWRKIGRIIAASEIADQIEEIIFKIGVRNISFSGGIDSTLLLYFMKNILGDPIHCYTIALDERHPDYLYAKTATEFFGVELHPYFLRCNKQPDEIVKIFYDHLISIGVGEIIAGDGIDEFACGYYSHQKDSSEENYIRWIRALYNDHLLPLNDNSQSVVVHLPYLAPEIITLLSLIPLYEKTDWENRKTIIVNMARGHIPEDIIQRWKYGFCDASKIK